MYATQYTTVYTTSLGTLSATCLLQAAVQLYFQIKKPTPDQSHNSTKTKLGEPMSLLGFIEVKLVIWKKGRINDSKAAASQKVPSSEAS